MPIGDGTDPHTTGNVRSAGPAIGVTRRSAVSARRARIPPLVEVIEQVREIVTRDLPVLTDPSDSDDHRLCILAVRIDQRVTSPSSPSNCESESESENRDAGGFAFGQPPNVTTVSCTSRAMSTVMPSIAWPGGNRWRAPLGSPAPGDTTDSR